jgi:uncharacterized protein DUF3592
MKDSLMQNTVIEILFLVTGALLASFGVWQILKSVILLKTGVRASATVVRNEEETHWRERTKGGPRRGGTQIVYYAIVEFMDHTGDKREVKVATGSNIMIPVGTAVEVVYDPAHIEEIRIKSFWNLFAFGVMASVFGLISMSVAIMTYFSRGKR